MNILVYATTFGADLWAFTHFVDQIPGVTIKVSLKHKERFLKEGIYQLYPLKAELVERTVFHWFRGISGFKPDVTISDTDFPLIKTSPNLLMLWHGFGWKGPNDEKEFRWLHRFLRYTWGSGKRSNPNFIWQCFGKWDFEHRTEVSGFHPDNCKILGAASHDYLAKSFDKAKAQPFYSFDVVNRPTVLIAPTWHYGEVFSHWGSDRDIFPDLIDQIVSKGGNVLLRLHDSFRFDESYRAFIDSLATGNDYVEVKYKDQNPDNFLDLQISDCLITNFSSIANLYYATGKPTIHVYPVKDQDEEYLLQTRRRFIGVKTEIIDAVKFIWKLPPEENGGLMARDLEELKAQIDLALNDPGICAEKSQDFLDTYMLGADGKNCQRIWEALQQMVYGEIRLAPTPEPSL